MDPFERALAEWVRHAVKPANPVSSRCPGYWQIGGPAGLRIYASEPPARLHRWCMKVWLGIEWIDQE